MTERTCPFPGCTELPDAETQVLGIFGSQLIFIRVEVCDEHKRMNEASLDYPDSTSHSYG